MNTYVNIGSSQDFRLSRALLVYGTSSYDGFPYRHPFVTLHDVIHDNKGQACRGSTGHAKMLIDLMVSLGKSVPVEILPSGPCAYDRSHCLVDASRERIMFFATRGRCRSSQNERQRYPHPPWCSGFPAPISGSRPRPKREARSTHEDAHGSVLELL